VGDDVFVDNEMLLVTDFVNLKINPAQFPDVLIKIVCTYVCLYR
jgi:hypothetical protein